MDKSEIKFRYVLRADSGDLEVREVGIEDLELGFCPQLQHSQVIIARDLFTGRKDDCGNELFENDIVEIAFLVGPGSCQETVKWFAYAGAFYIGSLPLGQVCNKIKKIGNVHFPITQKGEVI